MTGREMREIRLRMGMPVVEFGLLVLGSKEGSLSTVSRWVGRLENQPSLHQKTAVKVAAYYRKWLEKGHDDALDADYEKARGGRTRRAGRKAVKQGAARS